MPQLVLDPERNNITPTGNWKPSGPIPSRVRQFGFFSNIDDWLSGDLLLVNSTSPGWISRQIISAQKRGGYSDDDSRWHHAAMYIGEATLCEATGAGVHLTPLFGYIGSHRLRLRRDAGLTLDQRYRVVIKALARLRNSYSRRMILQMLVDSFKGFWNDADRSVSFFGRRAVICSQLYADAYAMATSRLIASTPTLQITPAALSESTQLTDVALSWKTIG
jgi:hypothetical protein